MARREHTRLHILHVRINDENRDVPQTSDRNHVQSFREDCTCSRANESREKRGSPPRTAKERYDPTMVPANIRLQYVIK